MGSHLRPGSYRMAGQAEPVANSKLVDFDYTVSHAYAYMRHIHTFSDGV
jgi:hypothetical protein